MPFKSEAQRGFLWKFHPEIARRWTREYGSKPKGDTAVPNKAAIGRRLRRRRQDEDIDNPSNARARVAAHDAADRRLTRISQQGNQARARLRNRNNRGPFGQGPVRRSHSEDSRYFDWRTMGNRRASPEIMRSQRSVGTRGVAKQKMTNLGTQTSSRTIGPNRRRSRRY